MTENKGAILLAIIRINNETSPIDTNAIPFIPIFCCGTILPTFQTNNIKIPCCSCRWSNKKKSQDVRLHNSSVRIPTVINEQPKVEEINVRDIFNTISFLTMYCDDCFAFFLGYEHEFQSI
jgi:hypothetical protein